MGTCAGLGRVGQCMRLYNARLRSTNRKETMIVYIMFKVSDLRAEANLSLRNDKDAGKKL